MNVLELVPIAALAVASSVGAFLVSMAILSRWVCNLHDSIPKWTIEYALHFSAIASPLAIAAIWLLNGKESLIWNAWPPVLVFFWFLVLFVSTGTFTAYTLVDVWKIVRGPVRIEAVSAAVEPVPFAAENSEPSVPLGRWNQIHRLNRVEIEIGLPELDREWDGLRIGHLSDFHFGRICNDEYIRHAVDRVMEKTPDLIALTGDFINYDKYIENCFEVLSGLSAPLGVFVVRGNHDYWCDLRKIEQRISDLHFTLLRDRMVEVKRGNAGLLISGTERPWDLNGKQYDYIPRESRQLKVVLCHIPDEFPRLSKRNPDLVLSGHTHGGQVCFPFFGPVLVPSKYGRKYASGVFKRGKSLLYVSRGIGCHPPLRTLCEPEVAILKLVRKEH